MPMQPVHIEFDDPIPCTLRLPGIGGAIEGTVIAVEIQPNGDPWIQTTIGIWQRWHTQIKVGKPSERGIGPAWTEMWAPGYAVEIDNDRRPELEERMRVAEVHANAAYVEANA